MRRAATLRRPSACPRNRLLGEIEPRLPPTTCRPCGASQALSRHRESRSLAPTLRRQGPPGRGGPPDRPSRCFRRNAVPTSCSGLLIWLPNALPMLGFEVLPARQSLACGPTTCALTWTVAKWLYPPHQHRPCCRPGSVWPRWRLRVNQHPWKPQPSPPRARLAAAGCATGSGPQETPPPPRVIPLPAPPSPLPAPPARARRGASMSSFAAR